MTRNRAKCKLCNTIIESFTMSDYVECKCGEIAIDGGAYHLYAFAKDYNNFFRLDDSNKELTVTEQTVNDKLNIDFDIKATKAIHKPLREEILDSLQNLIDSYDALPEAAMYAPVTHADLSTLLPLLLAALRCDCSSDN